MTQTGTAHSRLAEVPARCVPSTEPPSVPRPPPEANPHVRVVSDFFTVVRSGRAPERAGDFMAPLVKAHQLTSEHEHTVERTPSMYAAHVLEMQEAYGSFSLEITELFGDGARVYVRWRQTGRHNLPLDGFAPSGRPLIEIASAVYRLELGKIVEYWVQIDREGLRLQLERNALLVAQTGGDRAFGGTV